MTPTPNWNEIQFLSWDEFRRMAPSILTLEVTRIGDLLEHASIGREDYNALVRVRHAMKTFVECVQCAQKDSVQATCEPLLMQALLSMPAPGPAFDIDTNRTIDYIVDRLKYILQRIPLIY
jgi:hypothetical protein